MNRLLTAFAVAAFTAVVLASGAAAQVVPRNIPPDAQLGKLNAATASLVEIDGRTFRLAPGARFLNARNLTVTPNMIEPGQPVRYALDARGHVRMVWLVSEDDRTSAAPVTRTPGTR